MEFKFLVDEILPQLSMLSKVVSTKNAVSILDNILLDVVIKDDAKYMVATASDSGTYLKVKCPLQDALSVGQICVDAKVLIPTLANLAGKEITMVSNAETHMVHATYANGNFKMPFLDATDYPLMPGIKTEGDNCFTTLLNASRLADAIDSTKGCVADDPIRPQINCVHFDFLAEEMVCVGLDMNRLCKYTDTNVKNDTGSAKFFTLSVKPANILSAICARQVSDVKVQFDSSSVAFSCSSFYLISTLVQGNYPNYNMAIPTQNSIVAMVEKESVLEAVKHVLPMGSTNVGMISMEFSNKKLCIKAEDKDFSTGAEEYIDCDYNGEDLRIGFNGSYVQQMIQNIECDDILMRFQSFNKPALFEPREKVAEGVEFVSVIMPLVLN